MTTQEIKTELASLETKIATLNFDENGNAVDRIFSLSVGLISLNQALKDASINSQERLFCFNIYYPLNVIAMNKYDLMSIKTAPSRNGFSMSCMLLMNAFPVCRINDPRSTTTKGR